MHHLHHDTPTNAAQGRGALGENGPCELSVGQWGGTQREVTVEVVMLGLLIGGLVLGVPILILVLLSSAHQRLNKAERRLQSVEREVTDLRSRLARRAVPVARATAAQATAAQATVAQAKGRAATPTPVPTVEVSSSFRHPAAAPVPRKPARPRHIKPRTHPPRPPAPTRPPISIERLAMWLAAGLGGISVVLATVFALSAAIEQGWVGPSLRIAGGLLLGMSAWWGGTIARSRRLEWVGSALVGAGIAALLGSLYAANVLYDLISSPITFALLAAVSGVALLSGVRQGSRFDAWLGLLGGLATPVLVKATEPRPLVLFGYLLVLVAGTAGAAVRRGWGELVLGAAFGFSAVFFAWTVEAGRPVDQPIALGAVALLVTIFAVTARAGKQASSASGRALSDASDKAPRKAPKQQTDHAAPIAAFAAAVLGLLAIPWLDPADPVFYDPRTSLSVFRPSIWGPWVPAIGLLAVAASPVLLLRTSLFRWLASLVVTVMAVSYGLQQADVPTAPWPALALALAGLPLLALVPRPKVAEATAWTDPLLPLSASAGLGAAAVLAVAKAEPDGVLMMGLLATLPAVLVAVVRKRPEHLMPALVGAALTMVTATQLVHQVGPFAIAGPAALAFGLFGTLPLLLRGKDSDSRTTITAALAGPAFFLPLYASWKDAAGIDLIGLLPVLLGAVSLVGALNLVRQHGARRDSGPLALFVGVTLLGVTAAIPIQLRDQWVTVAWALEAAAVAWASRRLDHPLLRWTAVALAAAVTIRLTLNPWALEYADAAGPIFFNWTLYTWGLPALCLLAASQLLGPASTSDPRPRVPDIVRLGVLLGAMAVGFALVNVQVSHAFQSSGPIELGGKGVWQGMVRSLAWAAYGISILAAGTWRDHRVIRMVGFVVVLAAAGKVFLSDLWSLSGFVRVGSIAGLGVTLLIAAFVFERLVLRRTEENSGSQS